MCVCLHKCLFVFVLIRYFVEFLMAHNREVALHVRKEYVDTMGKVYYSYFKEYASKLMKLEVRMYVCTVLHTVCSCVCMCVQCTACVCVSMYLYVYACV